MSKVKVGKISNFDGSSSINTTTLTGGSNGKGYPKAWVSFGGNPGTGIAATVYNSHGIAGVTDSGSGIFTINFISGTFTNQWYAVSAQFQDDSTTAAGYASVTEATKYKSATQCGITCYARAATFTVQNTPPRVHVVFYGS